MSKINSKHLSNEHKHKISIANSGENSYFYGKFGENHPCFGKKHSIETLKKMSIIKSGENHPMFGKKHSIESLKKMSISHLGHFKKSKYENSVITVRNKQTGDLIKTFNGIYKVIEFFNISTPTLLGRALSDAHKSFHNMTFEIVSVNCGVHIKSNKYITHTVKQYPNKFKAYVEYYKINKKWDIILHNNNNYKNIIEINFKKFNKFILNYTFAKKQSEKKLLTDFIKNKIIESVKENSIKKNEFYIISNKVVKEIIKDYKIKIVTVRKLVNGKKINVCINGKKNNSILFEMK